MTASFDTAPLRGQSLRGRPVHERCMPVNQGNQPLLRRRGGGGLATALPSGVDQQISLTSTTPAAATASAFPSSAEEGSFHAFTDFLTNIARWLN